MAKTRKRGFRVTMLGILAVLAILTVLTAAICGGIVAYALSQSTSLLFSTRPDVQIPNLSGMTRQAAEADAQAAQLALEWQQSYDSTAPEGTICRQSMRAGRTAKAGQRMVLTVSLGTDWRSVPDLWGRDKDEAYEALRNEGLVIRTEFIEDGTVEPYTIIKTEPAAGTQVAVGDVVTVQVARPTPDPFRTAPSLLGLSLSEAKRRLSAVALQPLTIPANATEGTVATQSPEPGTLLRVNQHVTLYLG